MEVHSSIPSPRLKTNRHAKKNRARMTLLRRCTPVTRQTINMGMSEMPRFTREEIVRVRG